MFCRTLTSDQHPVNVKQDIPFSQNVIVEARNADKEAFAYCLETKESIQVN